MARAFTLLATNPAALLGVAAGTLAIDAEADLALVDQDKPWVVSSDRMAASAGNTPFDGQGMQGRVTALFKGGTAIT
jgi:dihydroorotase